MTVPLRLVVLLALFAEVGAAQVAKEVTITISEPGIYMLARLFKEAHTVALAKVAALSSAHQAQAQEQAKKQPETYLEPEAYIVYAALLPDNQIWGNWASKAKSLVIQQETTTRTVNGQECLPRGIEVREAWLGVVDDYKKQNQMPRLLVRSFPLEKPYDLVESQQILTVPSWDSFYTRYPESGGFIQLSAVGFNADKSKALVYISHHCGTLCGTGGYVFLEKRDGKWARATLKASLCGWISYKNPQAVIATRE